MKLNNKMWKFVYNAWINQKIIEKESTVIEELFYFISKYLKIVIIKTVVIKTAIKMQE